MGLGLLLRIALNAACWFVAHSLLCMRPVALHAIYWFAYWCCVGLLRTIGCAAAGRQEGTEAPGFSQHLPRIYTCDCVLRVCAHTYQHVMVCLVHREKKKKSKEDGGEDAAEGGEAADNGSGPEEEEEESDDGVSSHADPGGGGVQFAPGRRDSCIFTAWQEGV